jgi:hypothetical protein
MEVTVLRNQSVNLSHRFGLAEHASNLNPFSWSQFQHDLYRDAGVQARSRPAGKPYAIHCRGIAERSVSPDKRRAIA